MNWLVWMWYLPVVFRCLGQQQLLRPYFSGLFWVDSVPKLNWGGPVISTYILIWPTQARESVIDRQWSSSGAEESRKQTNVRPSNYKINRNIAQKSDPGSSIDRRHNSITTNVVVLFGTCICSFRYKKKTNSTRGTNRTGIDIHLSELSETFLFLYEN